MSVQGYLSHLQDVDAIENLQIGLTNLEGQGKIAIIDASDDKCWNFCARYAWRISAQVWLASASISKHGAPAMFAKALPLGANATFAQLLVLGFNFLAFCDMFHHMLSILFSSMQDSKTLSGFEWSRWGYIEPGPIKRGRNSGFFKFTQFEDFPCIFTPLQLHQWQSGWIYAQAGQCFRTKGLHYIDYLWLQNSNKLLMCLPGPERLSGECALPIPAGCQTMTLSFLVETLN